MVVSCLFLKLRALSSQSLDSYFPLRLLRALLSLLIFPSEVWMILPPRIIGVRIWIILPQKFDFFNLLGSCNTTHSLVRAITNFTDHRLSLLDLRNLLSTYIHSLNLFSTSAAIASSTRIFEVSSLRSMIPSGLLAHLSYNS